MKKLLLFALCLFFLRTENFAGTTLLVHPVTGAVEDPVSFSNKFIQDNNVITSDTDFDIEISNNSPSLSLFDENAAADTKLWRIVNDDGTLAIRLRDDADTTGTNVLSFARSGTTPGTITAGSDLAISGDATLTDASPTLSLIDSTAAADAKNWRWFNDEGTLKLQTRDDANTTGGSAVTFARSGTTPGAITITPAVTVNSSITSDGFIVSAGNSFSVASASKLASATDGYWTMTNNAGTGFTGLRFGGTTSSFPAIKRNGTRIDFRLADDSNDAPISALSLQTPAVTGGSGATSVLTLKSTSGTGTTSRIDFGVGTNGGTVPLSLANSGAITAGVTGVTNTLTGNYSFTDANPSFTFTATTNSRTITINPGAESIDSSSNLQLQRSSASRVIIGLSSDSRLSIGQSSGTSLGKITVASTDNVVPIGLKAASGQTANMFEASSNAGSGGDLFKVSVIGKTTIGDTTDSTSTSTGGLILSGGLGVAKAGFFGGAVSVSQTNSVPLALARPASSLTVATSCTNLDGSLHYGMNSSEEFAIAASSNLGASPWVTINSSSAIFAGSTTATSMNFTGYLTASAVSTLTVASGVITPTGTRHRIDTEGAAATDDVDTITAPPDGTILILSTVSDARDIVLKHGTGNMQLNGSADQTLNSNDDRIMLISNGSSLFQLAPISDN